MSYTYSRALVAASSPGKCSDIDASALLSGSPMPQGYSSPARTTALSRLSRFGMTFKPLTADRGAELLTSWLAGFPAKTSALQEKAPASPEPAAGCGVTWRASLAKFDPATSSWKTVQLSLLGDSELSSVTWPRSGMTADGQCWELMMSAPHTEGTGSGLWVPTPIATEWKAGSGKLGNRAPEKAAKAGLKLTEFAKLWPTPTVCGNHNRKGASATSGDGLATAVKQWATPLCRDSRTVRGGARTVNSLGSDPLITQVAQAEGVTDGALNPMWVEWLMGWPLGWTDLKPLATGRFPNAPQQHSECLPQSLEAEA